MSIRRTVLRIAATGLVAFALAAPAVAQSDSPIPVVASFSILGDMVKRIGGSHIALTTLVGPDGDAHVYQPTPADAGAVGSAKVLFVNGLEFEGWMGRLVEASEFKGTRVVATKGIKAIPFEEGDEHGKEEGHKDEHGHAEHAFEWAGVFDLSPGTYKWSFAKVDGKYADPAMKMVILKSSDIEASEEEAEKLLEAMDSDAKRHNDELVAKDKAYTLRFDASKQTTVFSVKISQAGKYAFYTEHMPFEFEADEHFFKDRTGTDVEPIAQEPDAGHGHHHGAFDPHAWQSLKNAVIYVDNITAALVAAAPANAAKFKANRAAYVKEMKSLEAQIRAMIDKLPENKRTVVTSHDAFGYFAASYGLKFEAPQGLSTESEASAADVAKMIRQIRKEGISAVFVETITDNRLLEQIARETGASIGGTLYSDALSGSDGPASTYLKMMRHNATTLTKSLGS